MTSRTVHIPVGPWVDVAAAASPILELNKTYFIEWSEPTIGYLRLSAGDDAPDILTGAKIFPRGDPRVGTASFTVPATGKIWIRGQEKDIVAEIYPAEV